MAHFKNRTNDSHEDSKDTSLKSHTNTSKKEEIFTNNDVNYNDDDYTSRRSEANSRCGNDAFIGYERGKSEFSGTSNNHFESE